MSQAISTCVGCLFRKRKGSVAIGVLVVAAIVLELGAATLYVTSGSMRRSVREEDRVVLLQLAEAGIQRETDNLWENFRVTQKFADLDAATSQAGAESPQLTITNELSDGCRYSVAIVGYSSPDSYTRNLTMLSVGWLDRDDDGALDDDEPRRCVRALVSYSLSRSAVFDYCYFVNNYGWMNGFSSTQLVVNGDMRANGNFDFSGGTPTINGSVYAAPNNLLVPAATGVVNITPNQWTNSYYETNAGSRARQSYNSTKHGAKGSETYEQWRDLIYDKTGSVVNEEISGAVVGDKNGTRSYSGTILDPGPMSTLPMPDLSDLSRYVSLSQNYVDTKATYGDGTANPYYNQGAYLEVWNSATSTYDRLTTDGVVTGSAKIIGTLDHPVKVHGPVTVTEDAVVKGYIEGQGTVYTGRNCHIVGSIIYKDPPDFRGTDPACIDNANEKKSMLALAARASIIMGDTSTFGTNPLQYMTPPFTKPRYDEAGNLIPAFDANAVDSWGVKKYRSVLGDAYVHSVASSINQIDSVLYTNFVGGGNVGGGGTGVQFNGSIISKDEAMVLFSLPFKINYDNRIKERSLNGKPLIDIDLPRTPSVQQLTWQEVCG